MTLIRVSVIWGVTPAQVCDDMFFALRYLRQNSPNHGILDSDV
jgi:hypothetical protein